ncbi:hypothetical protein, partial [Streptomyces violascens]|uniref:hypothetical protein n=1 Tax=Streptomyces violascens TaxID=67381 RepID=UPI00369651A9
MTTTASRHPEDPGQLSFPRHSARTQRFTLGAPRAFTVSRGGARGGGVGARRPAAPPRPARGGRRQARGGGG